MKMKSFFPGSALAATALLATAGALTATSAAAWAQDAPPVATAPAPTPPATPPVVGAMKFSKVSAGEAAARLGKAAGVLVVADGSVANTAVADFSTTGGNLPDALNQLVLVLPKGTMIRRVLLPALAPGAAPPSAEVIAKLASVSDGLIVPVMGKKVEAGADSVNVMGRVMTMTEAAPVIAALNLKPVYLLTSANADGDPVQKMLTAQTDTMKAWMSMTPDQRTAVSDKMLDGLLNMDPAARQAMFAQQMQMGQKFVAKIQSLPDGQRQQFWKDMTGGKFDGTMPPPPPPARNVTAPPPVTAPPSGG